MKVQNQVLKYLEVIYESSENPKGCTKEQFENELLDIVDEIHSRFNGSFSAWSDYQKQVDKHHE